jgi:hypothetical protein
MPGCPGACLVALPLLLSAVDEAVRTMPVHFSSDSSLYSPALETHDGFSGACGKGNVGDVHGESAFLIVWEDRTPK